MSHSGSPPPAEYYRRLYESERARRIAAEQQLAAKLAKAIDAKTNNQTD